MNALDFAIKDADAKVRETHGKNRSPRIDEINRSVGNALGSPYCAAGVSECFAKAARLVPDGKPFGGRSGSSQAIKRWFDAGGRLTYDAQKLLGWHGALFGWTNPEDPAHGHVGMVERRYTNADGKVTEIGTVEYNTDAIKGDRDGDGVYRCRRRLCSDGLWYPVDSHGKTYGRGHKIYFMRTDGIAGGEWWPA